MLFPRYNNITLRSAVKNSHYDCSNGKLCIKYRRGLTEIEAAEAIATGIILRAV
jgi:hypothetical protein